MKPAPPVINARLIARPLMDDVKMLAEDDTQEQADCLRIAGVKSDSAWC